MQPIKFLKIDSFDKKDTNDLFEEMCKQIAHMTPFEGKCRILNLSGSKEKIDAYQATVSDVLKLIHIYDVKFEFKVTYKSINPEDEKKKISPDFSAGQSKDYSEILLENQGMEIKNPDLIDLVKPISIVVEEPKIKIQDLSSLPKPPDFE